MDLQEQRAMENEKGLELWTQYARLLDLQDEER